MKDVATFRLQGFPLDMMPDASDIETRWVPFFGALEAPIRIFSGTHRFNLDAPKQRVQQTLRLLDMRMRVFEPIANLVEHWTPTSAAACADHARNLPEELRAEVTHLIPDLDTADRTEWQELLRVVSKPLWRRRWLKSYTHMYDGLDGVTELRGVAHHMVAWLPSGVTSSSYGAMLQRAFGTTVTTAAVPSLLRGDYNEHALWLAPHEAGLPYYTFLTGHELRGTWTAATWERLLQLQADLMICIDVVPLDRMKAEVKLDFVATATENALRDPSAPRDVRTERKLQTARSFQEQSDNGFFDLRISIAVAGRSPTHLDDQVRVVTQTASPFLRLIRPPYGQGPLAQFFSATPTGNIDAFINPRQEVAQGAAVTMPFGVRRPDRTDGITWIKENNTPIFFDPMRDVHGNRSAGHMVILGKTGSGKTLASFVWSMRLLAAGAQVVIIEPQGHARRFIQACGDGGAFYSLDMQQQINILDVVVTRDAEGRPPVVAAQILQVLSLLSVLLGAHVPGMGGQATIAPRVFSALERAILDLALQELYAPWAEALDTLLPRDTPTIADLCHILQNLDVSEHLTPLRNALYDEVWMYLVRGSAGTTYNGRTTVRWDFSADATAYDLTALEEGVPRALYMMQAFAALHRYVRQRPNRDRPLYVIIDEFAFTLGKAPQLAQYAADAVKTWRTFGAALWTMDQDAHTFAGINDGSGAPALRSVLDNAPVKAIFQQDALPATRLGEIIDGLQPYHVTCIRNASLGECVIAWQASDGQQMMAEVFHGDVNPSDDEMRAFRGT